MNFNSVKVFHYQHLVYLNKLSSRNIFKTGEYHSGRWVINLQARGCLFKTKRGLINVGQKPLSQSPLTFGLYLITLLIQYKIIKRLQYIRPRSPYNLPIIKNVVISKLYLKCIFLRFLTILRNKFKYTF